MTDPPDGLDAGGLTLWQAATAVKAFHPGELVVLEEACRIKDRLDLFHRLLLGDGAQWMTLRGVGDKPMSVVVVDSAVTEARLHAGELRQLVEKLRLPIGLAGDSDGQAPKEEDDALAAARKARADRQARASGVHASGDGGR